MNNDMEIYRELENKISSEDKARLEGYLHGRAEATQLERQKGFNKINKKEKMSIPKKKIKKSRRHK